MTASRILEALARNLREWARANRCAVRVAPDPQRAMDALAAGAPDGGLVALWYAGESPAADMGICSDEQLMGRFTLAVAAHPGMAADRASEAGSLALAESLRRHLLRDDPGEGLLDGWRYAGMDSFRLPSGTPPPGGYTLTLEGVFDCGDDE